MIPRPGLLGGVAGLVLFAWLLTEGTFDLVAADDTARFFDAQTSAWLDGRWDVDPFVAGVEGIVRNGRTYIYFGVFPSLLRLPVAAVAELDGQWTRLSMLGAVIVAMAATRRLAVEVLGALRPGDPGRVDAWVIASSVFVVGAGSSLTFLASRPLVYHEAGLWGAALALVALAAALEYHREPSARSITVLGLAATGSLLSRPSAALGALAAIGLLGLGVVATRHARRLPGRLRFLAEAAPRGVAHRQLRVWPLVVAGAAPLVAYAAVIAARFGTFLRIPFDDQVIAIADPQRQAFVDTYGYFDPRFVGTTVVNYLAPIGAGPSGTYPFVDFAAPPGPQVGDTPLAAFDRVAGAPLTMPALVVAAIIGCVVLVRRRREVESSGVAVVALAGMASGASILAFGALAHRYTADLVPALAVPALVGATAVAGHARLDRRAVAAGAGVLVAWSVWFNVGLGLTYQRLWGLGVTEETVAGFLATQADLGPDPGPPERVATLPRGGSAGDLAAVDDCAGLYLNTGRATSTLEPTPWIAVERTEAVGRIELIADLELPGTGAETAIAVDGANRILVRVVGPRRVGFAYEGAPFGAQGAVVDFDRGPHRFDIAFDRHLGSVTVRLDGRLVLTGFYAALDQDVRPATTSELAEDGWVGTLDIAGGDAASELCRRLAADGG